MDNIWLGIICLIVGVFLIYDLFKYPVEDNYNASNTKGFIAAIGIIILGILLLLGKAHW
jgi:hypothetical protein